MLGWLYAMRFWMLLYIYVLTNIFIKCTMRCSTNRQLYGYGCERVYSDYGNLHVQFMHDALVLHFRGRFM